MKSIYMFKINTLQSIKKNTEKPWKMHLFRFDSDVESPTFNIQQMNGE